MKHTLLAFLLILASVPLWGQGSIVTGTPTVSNPLGQPIPGATVAICTTDPGSPTTGGCPAHLATLYTDITIGTACTGTSQPLSNPGGLGTGCSNPGTVNGSGNVVAFGVAGQYWCEFYGGGLSGVTVVPCIFPVTASSGSFTFTAASIANAGVFTNTQQNDYLTAIINGLNISSEYALQQGGNQATEAGAFAVAVPNTSTVHQANGPAGYVTNASTTTQAVGTYGQCRSTAANAACLGGNLVAAGTTGVGNAALTTLEADFNPKNASDTGSAITAVYGTATQSNNANAYLCSASQPASAHFSGCFVAGTGATSGGTSSPAISLGPIGSGVNHASQSIDLVSNDPTSGTHEGTLDLTAAGVLRISNALGVTASSKINSTAVGNGTTAGLAVIAAGGAALALKDTTQAADAKLWDIAAGLSANTLLFRALNDAENAALNWMTVTRTGVASATVAINAATSIAGITNGAGLQAFNSTTTCTTGASIGATCTSAAITLPVAYADTNYRVSCTGQTATNVPIVQTVTKSNTTFTITIAALTAAAATFTSYDCLVGHN